MSALSAFATKAGIHASALAKEPATYEHVPPETVGNRRKVMVSDQGGKANFIAELKRRGIEVPKADHRLDTLISLVKEREAEGYAYEGADASFELLARRMLHTVPEFFHVSSFRCMIERRFDANGQLKTVSEAIVKVVVDGEERMSVAEGHGPVNALDIALRKDLGKYQDEIADLELVDYKVRILNGGTEAITRVLIESHDATGARWWTVGVSDNIIDASFQALMDFDRLQADEEPRDGGAGGGGVGRHRALRLVSRRHLSRFAGEDPRRRKLILPRLRGRGPPKAVEGALVRFNLAIDPSAKSRWPIRTLKWS